METATRLHDITKRYNVPLIINDRVDVAIASGAEGVHLGQDDMCKHFIYESLRHGVTDYGYDSNNGCQEDTEQRCHCWDQRIHC